MKTGEYPYYQPSFFEYNVAQSAAVPFLDKDANLVISFATAAGKTVLAEGCFAFYLQSNPDCKVVYVCPFRSLASEKHEAWKNEPQLAKYGLTLSTGDTGINILEDDKARIVLTTSESFDSKTRSPAYRDLLRDVACVVFDEAHLMGDKNRGSSVEMSITRMARVNPKARLILLSATMGNAMELAKWLKYLNGKETKCIVSTWRPAKVETTYYPVSSYEEKVKNATKLAKDSQWFKTVVFVHSKITGADIVKRLRALGVRAAFHNASIPAGKRKMIEAKFNERMSGLNILVSTSTLSAGVNIGG
jgi:replicative superfamily II helicase